jgi:hypothetical protein
MPFAKVAATRHSLFAVDHANGEKPTAAALLLNLGDVGELIVIR